MWGQEQQWGGSSADGTGFRPSRVALRPLRHPDEVESRQGEALSPHNPLAPPGSGLSLSTRQDPDLPVARQRDTTLQKGSQEQPASAAKAPGPRQNPRPALPPSPTGPGLAPWGQRPSLLPPLTPNTGEDTQSGKGPPPPRPQLAQTLQNPGADPCPAREAHRSSGASPQGGHRP